MTEEGRLRVLNRLGWCKRFEAVCERNDEALKKCEEELSKCKEEFFKEHPNYSKFAQSRRTFILNESQIKCRIEVRYHILTFVETPEELKAIQKRVKETLEEAETWKKS